MAPRERKLSDVLKRGYSDDELSNLYELGRFFLESGKISKAAKIFSGISAVAPEFTPAWLGSVCVDFAQSDIEAAQHHAEEARKLSPESPLAALFLVTVLLASNDLASAGALLGEVGESIEAVRDNDQNLIRFYKMQLARFNNLAS